MQTDQKMVAYYFKKMGFFILRTLNELFKIGFYKEHFEKSILF